MKNKDLYIEILKFGKANLGKPVSFKDLKINLDDLGIDYDRFAASQFFNALFVDKRSPLGNEPGEPKGDGQFFLQHEGYFNLLEHEELVSARKSAFLATIFAISAIIISIISTGFSIFFSMKALNAESVLTESQIEELSPEKIEIILKDIRIDLNAIKEAIKSIEKETETKRLS